MTKRRELIKRLRAASRQQGLVFEVAREGGKHSIYRLGSLLIPVPRHTEINELTTLEIFKEAAPVLGKDWWK